MATKISLSQIIFFSPCMLYKSIKMRINDKSRNEYLTAVDTFWVNVHAYEKITAGLTRGCTRRAYGVVPEPSVRLFIGRICPSPFRQPLARPRGSRINISAGNVNYTEQPGPRVSDVRRSRHPNKTTETRNSSRHCVTGR